MRKRKRIKRKKLRIKRKLIIKREIDFPLIQKVKTSISLLKKDGYTTQSIAGELNLTREEIYYIQENFGEVSLESSYFNLNANHINWIKQFVKYKSSHELTNSKLIYIDFLSYFRKTKEALSLRQFQIIMKKYCRISYRLAQKKDRRALGQYQLNNKYQYSLNFLSLSAARQEFIFVDETTIGNDFKKIKCWQQKGQNKNQIISCRQQRICIFGGIGSQGFMAYQLIKGNLNSQFYIFHLKQFYDEKQFVIVLDNSPIHKSKIVQDFLRNQRHLFLPTYSPQLNPIERLWAQLKNKLNQNSDVLSISLCQIIHEYLNSLSKDVMENYVDGSLEFIKKSLFQVEF